MRVERGKTIYSADKTQENTGADVYGSQCEERKKQAHDAEHSCIARQCVAEYLEKMNVSAEQRCVIKFCVHLKKSLSETTALLKEAFGKEMLSNLTIRQWHKAFVDGRESAEFESQGSALWTVVTATSINTVTTVIEEDWCCLANHSQYFKKELVTEEDNISEDNESVTDDE